MEHYIRKQIEKSINIKQAILEDNNITVLIAEVSEKIIEAYRNGKKVLLAGNGGSAADAQHIAGELVSRFYFDRPGLAAIALTTDTSILTAVSNDYGYAKLFSRQIQANGNSQDIFIGISTSGNSKNLVEAAIECKKKNIVTIGLTGSTGGEMSSFYDYLIKVPCDETPRVQESHILIGHIICAIVERAIFGEGF